MIIKVLKYIKNSTTYLVDHEMLSNLHTFEICIQSQVRLLALAAKLRAVLVVQVDPVDQLLECIHRHCWPQEVQVDRALRFDHHYLDRPFHP